jgi:hypothetical protein
MEHMVSHPYNVKWRSIYAKTLLADLRDLASVHVIPTVNTLDGRTNRYNIEVANFWIGVGIPLHINDTVKLTPITLSHNRATMIAAHDPDHTSPVPIHHWHVLLAIRNLITATIALHFSAPD